MGCVGGSKEIDTEQRGQDLGHWEVLFPSLAPGAVGVGTWASEDKTWGNF